jgi:hypothetical protein
MVGQSCGWGSPHLCVRRHQEMSQKRLASKQQAKNHLEDPLNREQFNDIERFEFLMKQSPCCSPSHKTQNLTVEAGADPTALAHLPLHHSMFSIGKSSTYRSRELAASSMRKSGRMWRFPQLTSIHVRPSEVSLGLSMATAHLLLDDECISTTPPIEQSKQETDPIRIHALSWGVVKNQSVEGAMAAVLMPFTLRTKARRHSGGFTWAPHDDDVLSQQFTFRSGEY